MPVSLDEVVTGLGLLGNVMSLPRQVQNQQIQNEQTKALLKDSGLPEEMIKSATPEPMMRWLSPQQGGFTGHVLGGVGDVGSILSTVVGKPVKAPRVDIADLASASKLRSAHAEALAKKNLGDVIMNPKSSKRDIAAAAITAGSTDQALRLMRGDEGRPPASILGLRSTIESMDPDDPRLPAYKRALDAQLAENKRLADEANQRIIDRQPEHYDPAQTWKMRHDAEQAQRAKEADRLGLKGDERQFYLDFGHQRQARQPKADKTYEDYLAEENRKRNAMMKDPRLAKQVEKMEPAEITARRNMEAARQAAADAASGKPLPPPPPPPAKRGATGGAAVGALFGASPTETPTTTTPESTTTSTTQPPAASDDPEADAILAGFHMEDQPPEIRAQIQAAIDAKTPNRVLANWILSLPKAAKPATATPGP